MTRFIRTVFATIAFAAVLSSCSHTPAPAAVEDLAAQREEASRFTPRERATIIPRVDHHQHIVGPAAVILPPEQLPVVELPPALERVVQERNRISGTAESVDLYTSDAVLTDFTEEGDPWVRGRDAAARVLSRQSRSIRFVPNSFAVGQEVATITGVLVAADSLQARGNFTLGLEKQADGLWHIATEHIGRSSDVPFAAPVTAERLISELDIAGIERAVVLSVGYWFGSPNRTWPGDEYTNVRAENDWVAAEVARHPDRLVAFCGVSPLKDYALTEIRRCATELGMKGVKLHFRSSRVDVLNREHLEKVRGVFETANSLGLALVVHAEAGGDYGQEQATIFLNEMLPAAPDVPVQMAHLWGGNQFAPSALAVFADAVSAGDPRTRNLYFDLTEVEIVAGHSDEAMNEIAERIRQIGLERILYGSDAAAVASDPPAALRWARLRHRLPLTDRELRVIADNVAPYLK